MNSEVWVCLLLFLFPPHPSSAACANLEDIYRQFGQRAPQQPSRVCFKPHTFQEKAICLPYMGDNILPLFTVVYFLEEK